MNTKLHAFADAAGPPLSVFTTAGQVGDYPLNGHAAPDRPEPSGWRRWRAL